MSDDDLFDDFILDDSAAAQLDTLEKSYFSESVPPPPKRQKTNNAFDDDLPDISVDVDGLYAVRASARPNVSTNRPIPLPPPPKQPTHNVSRPAVDLRPRKSGPVHPPAIPNATTSATSQRELEELRRKVEELSKQTQQYQAEASAAKEANWAAQGEVTILRTGMNKVTLDHAQQIEKLKKAKEESEAKQIAIQKDMAAEMDRLKSARRFHDLDNLSRKVPMSVRSKKVIKDVPSTPLPVSSQMRTWDHKDRPERTPLRNRVVPESPSIRSSPDQTQLHKKLMGFHNAFVADTSGRTPQLPKVEEQSMEAQDRIIPCLEPIPFPQQPEEVRMDSSNPTETLDDFGPFTPADDVPNIPIGEPFNWKAELTRIILTHSTPSNPTPVLKLLSGLAMPPELSESYSDITTRVLDVIASTFTSKDYDLCVSGVCACLTSMATSIINTNQLGALAVLLDLLGTLSRSLPTFSMVLLNQSVVNDDEFDLVEILCPVIREQLASSKSEDNQPLAHEVLGLLEDMCWNLKDDAYLRFSMFCEPELLMVLLDTSQPSWLLCRVSGLLLQAATHPKLAQKLTTTSTENAGKPASALPHIDRLSLLLIDQSRTDDEGMQMKRNILTFFGALSVTQADIHTALVGSPSLVPSLAAFSSRLTTPFWEDLYGFPLQGEIIDKSIHLLSQTIFLLHYLIFGLEGDFNLRQRLQYAPSRAFNGITHVFLVTFGRLSCGDPPDWMTESQKREMESLSDMAQDLLDLVVDGPEADNIWAAFQADPSDAITVDDAVDLEKLTRGAG
ncbi:hypothetical protein C8F01DRAFT_235634 [Mycena amicta]|nr:hypothetical protein C8F01DRAFT_235634 [Mycena amicta]